MDDGPEGRAGQASALILLGEGQEEEELLVFHLSCVRGCGVERPPQTEWESQLWAWGVPINLGDD